MAQNSISLRMHERRTELGMNLKQLAEAVGVSRITMYRTEAYGDYPNSLTLCTMAEVLGVSIDWLVGRTDKREVNK